MLICGLSYGCLIHMIILFTSEMKKYTSTLLFLFQIIISLAYDQSMLVNTYTSIATPKDIAIQGDTIWLATTGGAVKMLKSGEILQKYKYHDGLTSNNLTSISIDKQGNVWFGTENNGLCLLKNERWTYFPGEDSDNNQNYGLAKKDIKQIETDAFGNIWVGVSSYLLKFDIETQLWKHKASYYNGIRDFETDQNGNPIIWTRSYGIYLFGYGKDSIIHNCQDFSAQNGKAVAIDHEGTVWCSEAYEGTASYKNGLWTKHRDLGDFEYVANDIKVDGEGNVWFATNNGLYKYDGSIWVSFQCDGDLTNNIIEKIEVISPNEVWCVSKTGVSVYNGSQKLETVKYTSLGTNDIKDLIIDSFGKTWSLGYDGSVSVLFENQWTVYSPLTNNFEGNEATCIISQPSGNMLIGTKGGIYELKNQKWEHVTWQTDKNEIDGLHLDSDGNILFVEVEQLAIYDGTTVKYIELPDVLKTKYKDCTYLDRDNNLWICANDKLFKYDGSLWEQFINPVNKLLSIDAFVHDSSGKLWCSSRDKLYCVEDGTWEEQNLGRSAYINDLTRRGDSLIACSDDGLYIYFEHAWERVDLFTKQLGEIDILSYTKAYFDSEGYLWLGTSDNGIVVLDALSPFIENAPHIYTYRALSEGWNSVVYSGTDKLSVKSALESTETVIETVKNSDAFYKPERPEYLNSLQYLLPNEEYKMYVSEVCEISWAIPNPSLDTASSGTVTDIDGNIYEWKKLGNQVWMTQNLRVTRYANGTEIPHIKEKEEWAIFHHNDRAYSFYENKYSSVYGALYTWTAASNMKTSTRNPSRVQGVCPDGWHLPSDAEWMELEIYLGMDSLEVQKDSWRGIGQGSMLADSAELWDDGMLKDHASFGETGFNAYPAGFRNDYGNFNNIEKNTYWWTATVTLTTLAYYRELSYYKGSGILRKVSRRQEGKSIRCIRD